MSTNGNFISFVDHFNFSLERELVCATVALEYSLASTYYHGVESIGRGPAGRKGEWAPLLGTKLLPVD